MTHRARQSAFVLLITLVLLALAATALAAIGRHSFRQALLAQQQQERLQRKWAFRSCEDVLLGRMEAAMTNPPEPPEAPGTPEVPAGPRPRKGADIDSLLSVDQPFGSSSLAPGNPVHPGKVRRTIELGSNQVQLVFADEQAKLNVNALLERRSRAILADELRSLTEGARVRGRIRLRPVENFNLRLHQSQFAWPAIASFQQIFPDASPADLLGSAKHPGPATLLACWGDGKVDFRRASQAVLEAVLAPELGAGEVQRLIILRQQDPSLTVDDALDHLELSARQLHSLKQRLTDGSRCWSLWVTVQDRQRRWFQLIVHDAGRHGPLAIRRFAW